MRLIVSVLRAAGCGPGSHPVCLAACGLFIISLSVVSPVFGQETAALRIAPDRPALALGERVMELTRPAATHYDVVALRVEFQPDDSRFTTGDGTFSGDLFGGLEPLIDPLPHDAAYFEAHLQFLENYVRRASSGRTTITTHLLPDVIRLSQPMGAYSPTGADASSDEELRKLAGMVAEAWREADATSDFDAGGLDPDRTAFLIFHAGVGRDLELMGTTLDKTPEDLPSLYFGESALRRLLDDDSVRFKGIDIDHTILSPRTETRRGTAALTDEPFLAEFSINGMLAATFFSYLGVPDLFNTESGESGIGPFGLMDPLGIFAFNGLLPPEPSAWTKHFLGWADQTTVHGAGPQSFLLSAASSPDHSPQVRVPISDGEYFLVENRHRKMEPEGVRLTVYRNGEYIDEWFDNDQSGFTRFDVSDFDGGVVVDASNFDWALPGGLDEDGNELNGGILIWHVDERAIGHGLAQNRVNADPLRRGVELKEADGAQDIGYPSGGDFGPQTHLGSPFDFYFEGNPVRAVTRAGREVVLYENRFGPDTTPSSNSREGGPSFITLEEFTAPGVDMSFRYTIDDADGIARHAVLSGVDAGLAAGAGAEVAFDGRRIYVLGSGDGPQPLVAVNAVSGEVTTIHEYAVGKPAIADDGRLAFTADEDGTLVLYLDGERVPLQGSASPKEKPIFIGPDVLLMNASGRLFSVRAGGETNVVAQSEGEGATFLPLDGGRILILADGRARVLRYPLAEVELERSVPYDPSCGAPVAGRDAGGELIAFACPAREAIILLSADGVATIDVRRGDIDGELAEGLSMADVDEDGRLEIIGAVGSRVVAFTRNGAVAAGFPLHFPSEIRGDVLIIRATDTIYAVAAGADGYVHTAAVGDAMRRLPGTPLALGKNAFATPVIRGDMLLGVSDRGVLQAWQFDAAPEARWGERFGDPTNVRYPLALEEPRPDAGALIVAAETYNWPNPIRDGGTYVRVMTSRNAAVDVSIVDGAGRPIDELVIAHVQHSAPAEVFWTADAPSGLYFARITATDAEGRSESRVIKMAIVR